MPGRRMVLSTASALFVLSGCTGSGSATHVTASPQASPGAGLPATSAAEHRIGVRTVGGAGEFYDRITNDRFVPRGANYNRWVFKSVPGSGQVLMDSLFNTSFGQLDRAEADLAAIQASGYNVVRVWANACWGGVGGCLGDPAGGLSGAHLDNIAAFLRMAKAHGIFVMFTDDEVPADGGYQGLIYGLGRSQFDGYNANFLTEGGIEAERRFYRDFITGLIERKAALDAIFAYELRNEAFYEANLSPLSRHSGTVQTANGETYDLAKQADRLRMMDEGWLYWIDQVRTAIRALDPTALVTMGSSSPSRRTIPGW